MGQNVTVPRVVRTWSSLLYRAKTRTETVSGRGGSQRSEGAEKGGGGKKGNGEWNSAERGAKKQGENNAITLKETIADLTAPWH